MKKPFIVGIAGGSASGKSTFTDILEKKISSYNTKVIHMDDYFKPENERPYVESPMKEKMYIDDNHPETIYLEQFKTDMQTVIDGEYDIIILEGLLILWDKEIYSKLDLKLFVDCRADERIVRRIKRNMQWGQTYDEISNTYLDMVRYRHDEYVEPTKWRADVIINGSTLSSQSVDMVAGYIKSSITLQK